MRIWGIALSVFFFPLSAQADTFHQHVEGAAAQAVYQHTDGCTAITAIVTGLHARNGSALTDVVVVSGSLDDVCAGETHPFFGIADATATIQGMASAHLAGTVVATSFTDIPPITFELDLTFGGTGSVTTQRQSFRSTGAGGETLSFVFDAFRTANVSGSVSHDGVAFGAGDFAGAQLINEVDGDLVVVH